MRVRGLHLVGSGALGLAVLVGGCSAQPDASDGSVLTERVFESTAVTSDGSDRSLVEGSSIVLTFTADGIAVDAGCNAMSGSAVVGAGTIVMTGPMASTMMACDPALMDQDAWVADFFAAEPTWTLDGNALTLTSGGTEITFSESMEYVAQPEPMDVGAFVGHTFASVSSTHPLVESTRVQLSVEPGMLSVNAGCNTMRASYWIEGSTLHVGEIASTRMACSPELTAQDAWLTAFLGAGPTWVLDGPELTLTSGSDEIVFTQPVA